MSWQERIQTDLTITCGDERKYVIPGWMNASRAVEYNISEFEFVGLEGTKVHRGTPKGRRYNLELVFQGETHLELAEAFETSAAYPDPWKVEHPYYGSLLVQPVGLVFDDSVYNVTRITGTLIETIDETPAAITSAEDRIAIEKQSVDELLAENYVAEARPQVKDVNKISTTTTKLYNEGSKKLKLTVDSEEYRNAFNAAYNAVNNVISEPLLAMRQLQALINLPVQFADSVRGRISTLFSQFGMLARDVSTISSRPDKFLYQITVGTLIGGMASASVTNVNTSDYRNRREVLDIADILTGAYSDYLRNLDALQSTNGGDPDSFVPDAQAMIALGKLVSFAVSNLFTIAQGARQERTVYLSEETNIILVAHKYYGLQADDSTIDELIEINEIGLKEILQLRPGRRITYYV